MTETMLGLSSVALKKAGVAGLKWAWDNQDEVEPKLKSFYRFARKKILGRKPGVLVLGAGGTGKTTLGRILSGRYDFLLDTDTAYEQSIAVQTFRGKNNPDVELIVAPGQENRRDATWSSLLRRLSQGKELGIILCCSYGYHSLTISYMHHKLYDKSRPKAFLPKFLSDRRQDEIQILEDIMPSLEQNIHPTWLLTLVAKEDLWRPEEEKVRKFYTTGKYGQRIDQLMQRKGNKLFRHELVLGSLVIRNFMTNRGEHLKSNSDRYDHIDQVKSLRYLIETVDRLQEWNVK